MAYLAVNGNKVLDSSNYTDYCTPNNIGAATANHTHSQYITSHQDISGKVNRSGITATEQLQINPTGGSYNEGLRIGCASNGWSNISFGCSNTATSSTIDTQWLVGKRGAAGSKSGAAGDFTIEHYGSTGTGLTLYRNGNTPTWNGTTFSMSGHTHNYAGSSSAGGDATNADKVDGYHASSLWRSDGATWNPHANVSLTATANGQEWSFDIRRNGYTGCYWHVWDSSLSTMLGVYADSGVVKMPYGAEAKTFKATSDRNLKRDIEKIDTVDITSLHAYGYTFKNDKSNERKVGLIAQEVQQIIPEAVSTNDSGNLMLDYNAVTAVLVSTVNELQNQIKILTEKTNCLTAEIASLKNQS